MDSPIFFGVRHLSPAAAFNLRKALDEAKPDLVLVEGPSDLNDQMKWLYSPKTKYPAAILAYTKVTPVKTVLWPFAIYSPEIQAIKWAYEHNVECRFMDLPSSVFLAFQNDVKVEEEDEEPIKTESVYEKIETITGEDHDTFWERLFEQADDYQMASNLFGKELRESSNDIKRNEAENIIREAYMKKIICDAKKEGFKENKIFCVCGAYHVEGLKENNPMTDEEEKSLPSAEVASTLMPYSYYRLSSRSGYGAGNKAPAYFEMLWDAFNKNGLDEVAYIYLTKLADSHRKAGNTVSSAEVIEAVRLAKVLGNMRGSKFPTLADLKDAAITIIGHGNFSEVSLAVTDTEIGKKIGFLPEGVSRTSIQEDFYRQLKELNLEKYRTYEAQQLSLDLREKLNVKTKSIALMDLRRSFFLHRLLVLGIHFATILPSKQTNANWGEYYELRWTPEAEIEIVESALLGDTVEAAVSFVLKERADKANTISQAALIFNDAFLCGMPEAANHALEVLKQLSVDSATISEVADTASRLSIVARYGDLRHFDSNSVIPLIKQLYFRACLTLEEACKCDAKESTNVTRALDQLNLLQLNHDFLDGERWKNVLIAISDRDDLNTRCSGFAMAILLERGEVSEELLSREVSRRLSLGIPADLGAGWFEGLAGKNRYALINRLSLWKQLDDYLSELDNEAFKRALVFLRRAFADFSLKEKNDIAENLGEIWGVNSKQYAEELMKDMSEDEQTVIDNLSDFDFDDI